MDVDEIFSFSEKDQVIMALEGCHLHAAGGFLVFPIAVITYNAVSESKSRKPDQKGKFKSRSRRPSSY